MFVSKTTCELLLDHNSNQSLIKISNKTDWLNKKTIIKLNAHFNL